MSDHNSPKGSPEQEPPPEDIMMRPEYQEEEEDYRPVLQPSQFIKPTWVNSPPKYNQRILLGAMVLLLAAILGIVFAVANLQRDQEELRRELEQTEASRLTLGARAVVEYETLTHRISDNETQLATLTAEFGQLKITDEAQRQTQASLLATQASLLAIQDQLRVMIRALTPTVTPTATNPPTEPTLPKGECFGTLNSDDVSVLPSPGAAIEEVIVQLARGDRVIVMLRREHRMAPNNDLYYYYQIRIHPSDIGYVPVDRIDLDDDCDHLRPRDR